MLPEDFRETQKKPSLLVGIFELLFEGVLWVGEGLVWFVAEVVFFWL